MARSRISFGGVSLGQRIYWRGMGKRLICVRYRQDERTKQRGKAVELIVDRSNWRPEARLAGDGGSSLRLCRLAGVGTGAAGESRGGQVGSDEAGVESWGVRGEPGFGEPCRRRIFMDVDGGWCVCMCRVREALYMWMVG